MVEEMDPATLDGILADGEDVQVVDIRSPAEFARGHVPGAINVPFSRLTREITNVDWRDEIVVICPRGHSSIQASKLIQSYEGVPEGATVYNLTGGYREWDFELESGPSSERGGDVDAPF